MKLVELQSARKSVRETLIDVIHRIDSGEIPEVNDVLIVLQRKGGGILTAENGITIAQMLFLIEAAKFDFMMALGDYFPKPRGVS